MDKFILAAGCALRYREIGDSNKSILFLHGYMENLDIWEEYSEFFKDKFRILSLDIPGHGVSEVKSDEHSMRFLADVAADVLKKNSIESCAVVGHSMGGYVALALAKYYPELVSDIILFHSTPFIDTEERAANRLREIELIQHGKKEALTKVNPGKCFAPINKVKFKEDIAYLSELIYQTEDEGAIAILKGISSREDMNQMLKDSKAKQLFIFGKHDEFIPNDYAEMVIKEHPQAEVLWLENSGHMGFIEEDEKSANAIIEFIG